MLTVDLTHLNLKDGDQVLDLGCGEGRHLHGCYFGPAVIHAVGVDLSLNDVRKTRAGLDAFGADPAETGSVVSLAVTDALTLPFANHTFDTIICSEVLEHIADYRTALDEINRILKPGGQLAISVPRAWPEWVCWKLSTAYHQIPGGHIRIFKDTNLRSDIEKLGLAFTRRHWAHALHAPYWWLKCALWNRQESSWLIRQYHNFLVWDIMKRPWLPRTLDKVLNPLCGKSVVLYFSKPESQPR